MADFQETRLTPQEELYAKAIGLAVLRFVKKQNLTDQVESNALALLGKIKNLLDDDTLDDFHCLDAIVDAFHAAGISTDRHDF